MTTIEEAPIPFKPKVDLEEHEKVMLVHVINDIKDKASVYLENSLDPELVLCVVVEFEDVADKMAPNFSLVPIRLRKSMLSTRPSHIKISRTLLIVSIYDASSLMGQPIHNMGFFSRCGRVLYPS